MSIYIKGYSGPKALAAALSALLLLCLFPAPASAQTRTEERVETGRFGAEEPQPSGEVPEGEEFNTHWLYLGFRAGPSLRMYTPAGDIRYTGGDTYALSMDTALQANLRLLPFLSIQTEVVFTWDNASLWAYHRAAGAGNDIDRYTKDYTALSLQIPLIVKWDFYPGSFRFSPFLGAYYLLPLGKLKASDSLGGGEESLRYKVTPRLGLVGGLSGAMKLGPGIIFADFRYASDLGEFESRDEPIQEFKRSMLSFTIGYELGFFAKKKGADNE
jgi:hypothetical protein